jgi:hypothetical protein
MFHVVITTVVIAVRVVMNDFEALESLKIKMSCKLMAVTAVTPMNPFNDPPAKTINSASTNTPLKVTEFRKRRQIM